MKIIENNEMILNIERGKVSYLIRTVSSLIAFFLLFISIWGLRLFFYRSTLDCNKPEPNQGSCIITVHDLINSYTYKYSFSSGIKGKAEKVDSGYPSYLVILEGSNQRIDALFHGGDEDAQEEKIEKINFFFKNLDHPSINSLNIIDDYNFTKLGVYGFFILTSCLIINYSFRNYKEVSYLFDKHNDQFLITKKNLFHTKIEEYQLSNINRAILEETDLNNDPEESPIYIYKTKILFNNNSSVILKIGKNKSKKEEIINIINQFIEEEKL